MCDYKLQFGYCWSGKNKMHIVYIVLKKGEIEDLMEMKRDDRYIFVMSLKCSVLSKRKRSEEAEGRDIV
jgi:hypothetical protein